MYIGKSFLIFMYYDNVYWKNPHTGRKMLVAGSVASPIGS